LTWAEEEARKREVSQIETSVSGGDPAEEIINYANYYDMDLIVMGSRGMEQRQIQGWERGHSSGAGGT
jgi:nucleotide-binding universal stress UspA family protein